jgi:hypothetical protein
MSVIKGLVFVGAIAALLWFALQRIGPTDSPPPTGPVQVNVSVPNPVPGDNQGDGDKLYLP